MTHSASGWERVADSTGGTVGGIASARHGRDSLVFAATPVGVFCSSDAGRNWLLLGDQSSVPLAASVTASPHFEQDRTLFAGAALGLYRSTDGGATWQMVLSGTNLLSVACAVADDGEGPDGVLLAGSETDGILRSEDQGRTWSGANAGLLDLTVLALALSPTFALDRTGFLGTPSGLYRTRNGARSWRAIDTGLAEPGVQSVALSPAFAADHLVLAGTESAGLLRSDDAGRSWHRPTLLSERGVTAVAFSSRYPRIPTVFAATDSGVAVSDDAGATWRWAAESPPGLVLSLACVPNGESEVLLAGLHRTGASRSDNGGQRWEASNTGLRASVFTSLVLSPSFAQDRTLFVLGSQDNLRMSTDGGRSWAQHHVGPTDADVVALAVSTGSASDLAVYVATSDGVYVSRDGAATWHTSAGAVAPARLVATAPAQDPNDGRPGPVVAALADGTLLVSNDGGWTWGTRRQLPGGGGEILALALSPAYRSDATMFVATRQAGPPGLWDLVLWRSADGGQRWDRWLEHHVDSGPEAAQHLMAIAVSPAYPSDGLVFVGLGRRVLKPVRNAHQMHAGQRRPLWRAANLADGAAAVTALALSPNFGRDRTVFAATNAGVFVSRDAGESYQTWSDGLSPRGVLAVAASPEYREDRLVYALGLGGVLWRRHDDG